MDRSRSHSRSYRPDGNRRRRPKNRSGSGARCLRSRSNRRRRAKNRSPSGARRRSRSHSRSAQANRRRRQRNRSGSGGRWQPNRSRSRRSRGNRSRSASRRGPPRGSRGGKPEGCRTVWIGWCEQKPDEEELQTFFKDCGKITEVRCSDRNSRGYFAHVQFEHTRCVDDAMRKQNMEFMGQRVQIDYAYMDKVASNTAEAPTSRRYRPKSVKPPNGHTLWVGDVSIDASEQDLIDLFEKCGQVEMICLQVNQLKNGKFGHIKFFDTEAVDKAAEIAGTPVKGVPIRVDFAEDKPLAAYRVGKDRTVPESTKPEDCRTVWVGGLQGEISEDEIRSIFEKCGEIREIRLDKSKRSGTLFCHVEFAETSAVDRAVRLSGERVGSAKIRVDFAENRKSGDQPPAAAKMPPGMLPPPGMPILIPVPHLPPGMHPPGLPPLWLGPGPPPPGFAVPPGHPMFGLVMRGPMPMPPHLGPPHLGPPPPMPHSLPLPDGLPDANGPLPGGRAKAAPPSSGPDATSADKEGGDGPPGSFAQNGPPRPGDGPPPVAGPPPPGAGPPPPGAPPLGPPPMGGPPPGYPPLLPPPHAPFYPRGPPPPGYYPGPHGPPPPGYPHPPPDYHYDPRYHDYYRRPPGPPGPDGYYGHPPPHYPPNYPPPHWRPPPGPGAPPPYGPPAPAAGGPPPPGRGARSRSRSYSSYSYSYSVSPSPTRGAPRQGSAPPAAPAATKHPTT